MKNDLEQQFRATFKTELKTYTMPNGDFDCERFDRHVVHTGRGPMTVRIMDRFGAEAVELINQIMRDKR